MNTTGGWKRRDYKRQCSICGHPWKFSQLKYIGEGKWACPDDKKGLTATQISRHNARARALKVNAVKHPRPDGVVDTYQLEEAQIFNLVAAVAPWNTQADKDNGASKSTSAAARAAVYVGDILVENTRPATWLNTAATTLARCVTYLLTQQYGSGLALSDATGVLYGGVLDTGVTSTSTTAISCVAFLRSYQTTGNADHLVAAKNCATYLRHQQCAWRSAGLDQTTYSGGVYAISGVATGASALGLINPEYALGDNGLAIWALGELADVVGASTVYGESSSTYFTGDTRATLAVMIQNCSDFLSVGVQDRLRGGLVTGLSPTTPRTSYLASTTGLSTRSYWVPTGAESVAILTDQWAQALFGLDSRGLLSAQVLACHDYLLGMAANPANAETSLSRAVQLADTKGTYDPGIAPAVSCDVVDTTGAALASPHETTGTLYSYSAAAWLSPISSVRYPADFKRCKDALSKPRRVDAFSQELRYMGPLARSGLNFQVANLGATS